MPLDPRPTAFAFRRQRLDGTAPDALAAIEAVVGVYASNPSGPLSILARSPRSTAAGVLALERHRLVVRGRAMRTSAFVLPYATVPLVMAATQRPVERFAWMLGAAGIQPGSLGTVRELVLAAAVEPRTTRELRAATGLAGIGLSQLVSYLALTGDLVTIGSGSVTSNASRYQAREAWLAAADAPAAGIQAAEPASEEALAWLAGAYLRAFGPARVVDLAWWAGIALSAAAAAVSAHPTVDLGDGLLLQAGDIADYEASVPPPDDPVLAPKWDPWTMGYPVDGRGRFVDRDVHDRLFDGDGNGLGAVLVRGRAVGAWGHRGVRGQMEVDLDLFERPSGRLRGAIEDRLGAAAAFLGYRELTVREVPTVVPKRPRIRRALP